MKQLHKVIGVTAFAFLFVGFSAEIFAYSCPKGYVATYNQAGKQSGCRKI